LVLAANIRDVMEHPRDKAGPGLEEVARHHEEMAWVLSALTHEGEDVNAVLASKPDRRVHRPPPSNGELRWENEGGAIDDEAKKMPASDAAHTITS
jgi:hypothetical protein